MPPSAMPTLRRAAAGVIGYFLLINGPIASLKYRLPFEPVLIVLSAIPLARLIDSWSRQRAGIT